MCAGYNASVCDPGVKTLGEDLQAPFSVCNIFPKLSWPAKLMHHSLFALMLHQEKKYVCKATEWCSDRENSLV